MALILSVFAYWRIQAKLSIIIQTQDQCNNR